MHETHRDDRAKRPPFRNDADRCFRSLRVSLGLLTSLLSSCAYSQTKTFQLSGSLRDTSGKPVPYALVKLSGIGATQQMAFTFADAGGHFMLELQSNGDSLAINISRVGFETIDQHLPNTATAVRKDFILTPAVRGLPPINISEIPPIIQKKDTTIFNADSYKAVDQKTIGDLLRKVPGFSVSDDGKLSFRGQPIDRVLLESDDLFEREYGTLINNINPDGLDKLEVIQHYKDPTDLAKRLTQGNEQVLNLKFKRNKKARTFGAVSAGGGGDNDYEIKVDLVGLLRKVKFTLGADANSIGKLSDQLLGASRDPAQASGNNDDDAAPTFSPMMTTNGVFSPTLTPSRYNFNTTRTAMANVLYSPNKTLRVKAVFDIALDDDRQYQSSQQTYFLQTPALILHENDSARFKHRLDIARLQLNYAPGKRFQVIYDGAWTFDRHNQTLLQQLQGVSNTQHLLQHVPYFTNGLKLNYLIDSASLLSASLLAENSRIPETYNASPLPADSLFTAYPGLEALSQTLLTRNDRYVANIKYTHNLPSGSLFLRAGYTAQGSNLTSRVRLYKTADTSAGVPGPFSDDRRFTTRSATASLGYASGNGGPFTYSFAAGVNAYSLSLTPDNTPGTRTNPVLPSATASLQWQFSNISSFNLAYTLNNNLPTLRELTGSHLFNDYHTLWSGSNVLQTGIGHSATAFYSLNDLVHKKLLVTLGALFNRTPASYAVNFTSDSAVVFNTALPTSDDNLLGVVFGRFEKLSPLLKSRFILTLTYNTAQNYNATAGVLNRNNTTGQSAEFQWASAFNGCFNADLRTKATLNAQRPQYGPSNHIDNYFITMAPHVTLLQKKLVFTAAATYLSTHSSTSTTAQLWLFDLNIDYRFCHNKLNAFLQCQNLTNRPSYQENYNTADYYQTAGYSLRRTAIGGLTYIF